MQMSQSHIVEPIQQISRHLNAQMCIRDRSQIESESIAEVSRQAASALLRGARGNSGVILSLLFRGFAKGLDHMETADGENLANALGLGVDAAYKAVMKPTEGTMLTVARVAYEKGKAAAEMDRDPIHVWSAICKGCLLYTSRCV